MMPVCIQICVYLGGLVHARVLNGRSFQSDAGARLLVGLGLLLPPSDRRQLKSSPVKFLLGTHTLIREILSASVKV